MSKRSGVLAKRYAKAMLKVVLTTASSAGVDTARTVAAELIAFADFIFQNTEVRNALMSPMFRREERKAALESLAQHTGVSQSSIQLLSLLALRDRLPYLKEIALALSSLADAAAGVVQVEILTATSVAEGEAQEIERGLASRIQGSPKFRWNIDPAIIGGMVIRYDGKVIDGSIQGQLERLEKQLLR